MKSTQIFYGRLWKAGGEEYQKKFPGFEQYYLLHKEEIDKELEQTTIEKEPISEVKKKKEK